MRLSRGSCDLVPRHWRIQLSKEGRSGRRQGPSMWSDRACVNNYVGGPSALTPTPTPPLRRQGLPKQRRAPHPDSPLLDTPKKVELYLGRAIPDPSLAPWSNGEFGAVSSGPRNDIPTDPSSPASLSLSHA